MALMKFEAKNGILLVGGSFNPIHSVHLQMGYEVATYLQLREVLLIPNFQTPGKECDWWIDPQTRFALCMNEVIAFQDTYGPPPFLSVSQIELAQKKAVYTINTLKTVAEIEPRNYLLVGLDQMETFRSWKDYESILKKTQICVVNREGYAFPKEMGFARRESQEVDVYVWERVYEIFFFKKTFESRSSTEIRKQVLAKNWDHPWLRSYQPASLKLLEQAASDETSKHP
jgi:nicotinate-nucleotide adenylyltransferase